MWESLQTILLVALMLGGLIFFHELGHFVVARLCGVRVMRFSIGFGPQIAAIQGKETVYRIGALPLGGYVEMLGGPGADPTEEVAEEDKAVSFSTQALWKRILIVLAGPLFNLILPFIVFFFIFIGHPEVVPSTVGELTPDGVAAKAGLQPGDRIVSIDGEETSTWWELQRLIGNNPGEKLDVVVERDGEELSFELTPATQINTEDARLGMTREVGRIQITPDFRQTVIHVEPGSPAERAGLRSWDRILAINGTVLERWVDAQKLLQASTGPIQITFIRDIEWKADSVLKPSVVYASTTPAKTVTVARETSAVGGTRSPGRFALRGIQSAEWLIYDVVPDSPAAKAGLKKGDQIVGVMDSSESNVKPRRFPLWNHFVAHLKSNPERTHTVMIRRAGASTYKPIEITLKTIKTKDAIRVEFGAVNRNSHGAPQMIPNSSRLSYALYKSWTTSTFFIRLTLHALKGLVTGAVAFDELSGPVGIGQAVSKTKDRGFSAFFQLMAYLSISLGLINLLPIPLLDGGHLFFFLIEAIKRRPVSMRTMQIASYIGFSFIILLMVMVFKNDIQRIWF